MTSAIHALTERAMVMNLSISLWEGYRLDKEASREITEAKGAAYDAARVNKHLVPKETLADIKTAASIIRNHFYDNTLPWRDNRDRLMTRKLYIPFITQHERLVTQFNEYLEVFLKDKYPKAIDKAEFRMGELFDRGDYPSAGELRHKFSIHLEIDALTTSNDFRVQIDADHVARVQADMERAAEQRVQSMQLELWKRLMAKVSYFAERLEADNPTGDGKAVFRDSLVDSMRELVAMIPDFNVLDDPNIEAMRLEVASKLAPHDAVTIRKDPELREELVGEAKQIMDRMAGFMKAFGAAHS